MQIGVALRVRILLRRIHSVGLCNVQISQSTRSQVIIAHLSLYHFVWMHDYVF